MAENKEKGQKRGDGTSNPMADALRANLKKRKSQAQARGENGAKKDDKQEVAPKDK